MSWDVIWLPDAEQELAATWLEATDRSAITYAAFAIDQQLALSPFDLSESRPNGQRIAFSKPLGVRYRVLPGERIVQVLHVWRFESPT